MDFFGAQDQARRQSRQLVLLFFAAIGVLVAAFYLIVWQIDAQLLRPGAPVVAWDGTRFLAVFIGVVGIVGGASAFKLAQLSSGGGSVAESVGGRKVDPTTAKPDERRLLNVVEEMAIASGIPVPAVYVLDREMGINAFAAGSSIEDAAIAVTRGCVESLSRDELQGVIAHEFSHILNGDMRLNIRLGGVIFGLLVLSIFGRMVVHSLRFSGGRRRDSKGGGGQVLLAILLIGLALLILGFLGQIFGRLIQSAVSRQREFLADASAVQFTRNPGGIRDALRRIGGATGHGKIQDARAEGLAHCFFSSALTSNLGGGFSTHPPLGKRIRAIDGQWDGSYLEPRRTEAPPKAAPAGSVDRGRVVMEGATIVAAVGALSTNGIAYARKLRQRLPQEVDAALRDPGGALTVVLGLLLDTNADVRSQQLKLIAGASDDSLEEAVSRICGKLSNIDPMDRLPLAELAIPALREISVQEYEALIGLLDKLIEQDDKVTAFEFSLRSIVRRRLGPEELRAAADTVRYRNLISVREPVSHLLSYLAFHSSGEDPTAAQQLLERTLGDRYRGEQIHFDAIAIRDLKMVEMAFAKLRHASPALKSQVIRLCAQLILDDEKVELAEAELLRMTSIMLGCPMPPVSVN